MGFVMLLAVLWNRLFRGLVRDEETFRTSQLILQTIASFGISHRSATVAVVLALILAHIGGRRN